MRLLIITQTVDKDDPILGFFHHWLELFSKRVDKVTVICLNKGHHTLPSNVEVLSLGKEISTSKMFYLQNFFSYIFKKKNDYSHVFVHMNPIYVVLGGLFWRMWKKKVSLWYIHRHVDWKLLIAERLSDTIFTATKESFRIESPKRVFIGHGIDADLFTCSQEKLSSQTILSVSRIDPIKNLETLVGAANILHKEGLTLNVRIVGPVGNKEYFKKLTKLIDSLSLTEIISFIPPKTGQALVDEYCSAAVSVNLSPTGGTDKVILESLSCGTPAVVSNKALIELFGDHSSSLIFKEEDAQDCAQKIKFFLNNSENEIAKDLQEKVRREYSSTTLIKNLITQMQN